MPPPRRSSSMTSRAFPLPPPALAVVAALLAAVALAGCGAGDNSPVPPPNTPTAHAGTEQRLIFDQVPALPPSGRVLRGSWQIRPEASTPSPPNALCQIGTAAFPAITLITVNYPAAIVTVRFKTISDGQGQAAGIIFRMRDKDNYYILHADALADSVDVDKYVNGRRVNLSRAPATVHAGQWHELRVDAEGATMTGYLDGDKVVTASDSTFTTGGVGLWTTSDSRTCFDDVTITRVTTDGDRESWRP
jgi:hypothetical protein